MVSITYLIRPIHFQNQTMQEIQTPMVWGTYVSKEDLEISQPCAPNAAQLTKETDYIQKL